MNNKFVLIVISALMLIIATGCGDTNYLSWLSDDGTPEACSHQVDVDLDAGKYDKVVASDCADYMDLAAANLGLAGFDITTIINRMIDANDPSANAFDVYMNQLVANVTNADIIHLANSRDYYDLVNSTNGYSAEHEQDALFYGSAIVGPIVSFTFIKSSIDPDGDGQLSECDVDGNGTQDEIDAAGCSLLIAAGSADCSGIQGAGSGITVDTTTYESLDFPTHQLVYNGLTMDFGIGNATCPGQYNQVLSPVFGVAVTSMEKCFDSDWDLVEWNCPYETEDPLSGNAEAVSLVEAFSDALVDASGVLDSLGFAPDSTVYESISTVQNDACGGGVCTEQDLQEYLQCQLSTTPAVTCP